MQFLKSESDFEVTLEEKPVDVESGIVYFATLVTWYVGVMLLKRRGNFLTVFKPSIGIHVYEMILLVNFRTFLLCSMGDAKSPSFGRIGCQTCQIPKM